MKETRTITAEDHLTTPSSVDIDRTVAGLGRQLTDRIYERNEPIVRARITVTVEVTRDGEVWP